MDGKQWVFGVVNWIGTSGGNPEVIPAPGVGKTLFLVSGHLNVIKPGGVGDAQIATLGGIKKSAGTNFSLDGSFNYGDEGFPLSENEALVLYGDSVNPDFLNPDIHASAIAYIK